MAKIIRAPEKGPRGEKKAPIENVAGIGTGGVNEGGNITDRLRGVQKLRRSKEMTSVVVPNT